MIHRVIFGFSKDLYGEHVQNETSTLANTDSTSVCWPRLVRSTKWTIQQQETRDLRIGYFGSSTGGAAALVATSEFPREAGAIVSSGGRPDLAGDACQKCKHRHCSSSAATMTLSSS